MDPISDMLTSIRNAIAVKKSTVFVPFSKLKYEIAKLLEKEGFVEKIRKKGKKRVFIEIDLKYSQEGPVIQGIKRISKPGQRIYLPYTKIKKVKAGYGIAIISTSRGLMTDREAKKRKLGGEIICEIW